MPMNLVARRERLRKAIAALMVGGRRRYPAALRSQIAAYCRERTAAGGSISRVSVELGVSHPTLVRLVAEQPAPMRRVRVIPATVSLPEPPRLLVRGPAGLVVEGLDVEGVAALVRALA